MYKASKLHRTADARLSSTADLITPHSSETDPSETDPSETDPSETDPSETDPSETDPSETDPSETDPSYDGRNETMTLISRCESSTACE